MKAESWARFAKAIEFYESNGFRYRDLQWVTSPEYSAITKPEWAADMYLGGTDCVLLGSAEQAFLHEYDSLDDGLYYAITPCFRDEEELTEYTRPYFIKLELFSKNQENIAPIFDAAWKFFAQNLPDSTKLMHVPTDEWATTDLTYRGIELGSYSTRKYEDMRWTCGTGLAEPRFTAAIQND